ncbi:hypothetical protein Hanom_Chr02g00142721 [Helianthus anomalus]
MSSVGRTAAAGGSDFVARLPFLLRSLFLSLFLELFGHQRSRAATVRVLDGTLVSLPLTIAATRQQIHIPMTVGWWGTVFGGARSVVDGGGGGLQEGNSGGLQEGNGGGYWVGIKKMEVAFSNYERHI